ncbi:hypothetical protein [Paludisphaera rhizosphaerae]|uniref:hypothetical protein n=1 Tax=Paludisphaera rhizosphaerae TaxID=2711216 RepID=UPI0013EDDB41|nr:hypothetical protein [Paludisphaera rhizosphaerae]
MAVGGKSRRAKWSVEVLEVRALMATFQMPGVQGLGGGRNLSATFDRMVGSLQAQLAIQAPKDTAPEKLAQVVDEVVSQYEAASQATFAGFPKTTSLLVQQGEALRQEIDSLKLQYDLGLITVSTFNYDAYMEIKELTLSREVWPAGTPLSTFLVMATETSDGLSTIATTVQTTSTITDEQAAAVLKSEALAFQTEAILGATQQPQVAAPINLATSTFIAQVDAAVGQPNFAALIVSATTGFADALVNAGGAFGPGGSIGKRIQQPSVVADPLAISDVATFAHLQYREVVTTSTTVLHRNFTSASDRYGRFMTTDVFKSPAQAIRKLALDQSWYGTNQAYFVEDVTLPTGTRVYVGKVAPIYQGIFRREATPSLYPGMAAQYLVANTRAPGIIWGNFRATGT